MSNAEELRQAKLALMEGLEELEKLPQAHQDRINKLVTDITGIVMANGEEGFMALAIAGLAVQVAALKQGA